MRSILSRTETGTEWLESLSQTLGSLSQRESLWLESARDGVARVCGENEPRLWLESARDGVATVCEREPESEGLRESLSVSNRESLRERDPFFYYYSL